MINRQKLLRSSIAASLAMPWVRFHSQASAQPELFKLAKAFALKNVTKFRTSMREYSPHSVAVGLDSRHFTLAG
jgi:hypothetical protein